MLREYQTLATKHYELRYDPKNDPVLGRYVADYLEGLYADLSQKFHYEPKGPILVELFNNHDMFSGRVVALPDLHTIGACTGRMMAMVSPNGKGIAKPFNWGRVLRHEMVHIFNLETGYQFPETLALREQIKERYGIEVQLVRPATSVAEYEHLHGGPRYSVEPDQCCRDRKIEPLRRVVANFDAWLSAIRRDQTEHRARARVVQWDSTFGLIKINPLLNWTKREVWAFITRNNIPYNPLHDRGYPSIGCWPCTKPVVDGQDERSGRWAGSSKKECGLHVIEHEGGSGKSSRHTPIPASVQGGRQGEREIFRQHASRKCCARCKTFALFRGEQGQQDKGNRRNVDMAAARDLPNRQRMEQIERGENDRKPPRGKELNQPPDSSRFEGEHRGLHHGDGLA